ncbi:hypothetical protein TTHERM_01055460 (macronuclear) [Tetrahymena thermophila SB210]|uniref:Uncharacterized protein n=1 Tax=Tetrahymena thermophila (strain SB210) TaxID=312017 RepID=Q24HP1_TETTS|nr:hypothetical protein TTHERM_01055460 [Tetrahymena thermophila SB210]EAS07270.2 hypothetical protein TTHERM_01055460 [Tetrahymena thermophila SB210]|eukprot:XP_001027512.2 hypothetical protein TTHERM_01055460 [Tetrahymena thermophila SB210]
MDQDVLSGSGRQNQNLVRRRSSLNQNGISNNTPSSSKKLQAKQEEQSIINMVVQVRSLYIDLKNPQLKLLFEHINIQYLQDNQLNQIKLKASVFHNEISNENFEYTYECPVKKNKRGIQKEKEIILDKYVSFMLQSSHTLSNDQEFSKNSYILFEIYTQDNNSGIVKKEREQRISLNELKSQTVIEKNLKFFKETDTNGSSISKFDLQLQAQLIYNQKRFLDEIEKESKICRLAVSDSYKDFKQNLKKMNQQPQNQQQQHQQNFSETSQLRYSSKETLQTENDAQVNPTLIFYNLFEADFQSPSNQKLQRSIYYPKSQQYFDSTNQSNNKISALDYQESYSCQFQNNYMVEEEDDDEQEYEKVNTNSNNIIKSELKQYEEQTKKINEEEEEDNEEYKSQLFLQFNSFNPHKNNNLDMYFKNDTDEVINMFQDKQNDIDLSSPIYQQSDQSAQELTSPISIQKNIQTSNCYDN